MLTQAKAKLVKNTNILYTELNHIVIYTYINFAQNYFNMVNLFKIYYA